ncbi:IS200/IS605 family transposase OrfB [Candidatus Mancarchaeum acidiphilum]|uniref:IS200/IS605 family transposase OrfB n=2 Tax=Candidatus Mancarchaeum acidiphilum TaxID=1920749 RepID=A0A218NN59_9ARCH|nr:IS200/IS605 family transposase OrfB [Candidatus Mancarchaeum acidiphilum]
MFCMKTAYEYRAYPSKEQKGTLNRQMYLSKELYNLLLEKSKSYYKKTGKTLTEFRMNVWITKLKKEKPEFAEIHSQVLQNISKRVSDAYKHFFLRCKEKRQGKKVKAGFPRYKKFVSSLTYPQTNGFKIEKKKVELSKVGRINFVNHRNIEGRIKTLNIKKTKSQEWYITIAVEKEDKPFISNGKPKIGIDLGIMQYVALSDNTILQNAKITKHQRKHSRVLQQNISRKEKGSSNRRKAVARFARYSEHISRIRLDCIHKISNELVNSYSFIAYEDLEINNMVKNHRYAKSISESSWGNFTQLLQYKAESAGCVAMKVNPQYTSMTCSKCGNVQSMSISQRIFVCEKCGMSMDRDVNAAQNILKRALDSISPTTEGHSGSQACRDDIRPSARGAVAYEAGTTLVAS